MAAPLGAQDALPPASSTWSHDRSGLSLPTTLAGFTRGQSRQYDEDGYNVSINFRDDASGSSADVYVYRAAPASVPLWGDRAVTGMFANPNLGEVDVAAVRIGRFTPPNGAGAESGLKVVTPIKGDLASSGLAIYAHDGWLVKLRMSSRTLDATAIEMRMAEFIAGLRLPAATRPAPPLADIADCTAPLKSDKKAKLMQLDMMGTIMLGATLGTINEDRVKNAAKASASSRAEPVWCRDASSQPQYGVYRSGGEDDAYLVAIGDSGTSLSVGRYDMGPLMKPSRGFLVTQSDGVTELVYPPFDRLPLPEQMLALPGKISPVSSISLVPGEENKQTIIVPPK